MSQDIISDALNMIKNAKKEKIVVRKSSKLLLKILEIMKNKKYINSYKFNPENNSTEISIEGILECKAIKPRIYVTKSEILKYVKRYLPSRDIGIIIISTNRGLMTHEEALEKDIGGSLIAYCY